MGPHIKFASAVLIIFPILNHFLSFKIGQKKPCRILYAIVMVANKQFLFVCFVALCPKSTAMVMAGRSVHLTTLFPGQA